MCKEVERNKDEKVESGWLADYKSDNEQQIKNHIAMERHKHCSTLKFNTKYRDQAKEKRCSEEYLCLPSSLSQVN